MSTFALGLVFAYFLIVSLATIMVITTAFHAVVSLANFLLKRIK